MSSASRRRAGRSKMLNRVCNLERICAASEVERFAGGKARLGEFAEGDPVARPVRQRSD